MIYLFLLFLLLGACSLFNAPVRGAYEYTHQEASSQVLREIPIWIDKNFGDADKIEINNAIDRWNYALNGYVVLRVIDLQFDMEVEKIQEQIKLNGWLFMKLDSKKSATPVIGEAGYYSIGFVERVGGNHLYLIRDRLGNAEVFGVTLHEIGHLLGSPHVGDRLMNAHFSILRGQCIDFLTMQAVAKHLGLPLERLNFCYDVANDIEKVKRTAAVSEVLAEGCQAPPGS